MSETKFNSSTWLRSATYERGVLTLEKKDGERMVFFRVPSWVPGLLAAHRSAGRAFNLLVKGKGFDYRRIEAPAVEQDLEAALRASLARL